MGYPDSAFIVSSMNVEMNKTIGMSLAKIRVEQGLTQSEVALRLKKPQSYISKIEIGERNLYLSELFSYAKALGIKVDELVLAIQKDL